ncbi:MAG: PRC-barrel domain-containing protein [archaeon]|nr:PRC-barrel domain-containing protein [archaeon]MCR4323535.1 PRC-barrel domain-containing protein [Nanoarchaeota archaeon]
MRRPHQILRTERPLDRTINLRKLIGKRVLSKGGEIVGRISEIRINPVGFGLEGILVRGNVLKKQIYIGRNYFSKISKDAVILNIEVSVLIKNKKVITSKGEIIGRVKEVVRNGTRNDLKGVYVRSLFSREFFIPASKMEYVNKSIVLKPKYETTKKYFWQSNS